MRAEDKQHKVKILIVEDEAIIAEDLRFSLVELGYEVVGVADGYNRAMEMIESHSPDFAILDIIIDGPRDGIALAADIREKYAFPFVFLTSHADKDTVRRAKLVKPNGYLIKPFEQEDLYATIEIALSNFATGTDAEPEQELEEKADSLVIKDSMFVRDKYAYIKINFDDILFIQADGNYIHIHTPQSKFMIRGTLKETLNVLPPNLFYRVHRSYIINIRFVSAIHPSVVVINEEEIPVQKELRDELLSLIQTL